MMNLRVTGWLLFSALHNYWGYNTVCFFAPNTSYSSVVEHNHEGDELKELIYEKLFSTTLAWYSKFLPFSGRSPQLRCPVYRRESVRQERV